MIIKDTRTLTLTERERLKALMNQETQFGFVIVDLLHKNPKYRGMLIVPHVFEEKSPHIRIRDNENTYEKDIPLELIGNWEIECGEDIIAIEIK